jgi:3-methyladenine DNA glycosylase/8-oxoguanine DNA glycosylase
MGGMLVVRVRLTKHVGRPVGMGYGRGMLERRVRVPEPFDLTGTTRALGVGTSDDRRCWWWATRCPTGPATIAIAPATGGVGVRVWGPGADELSARVPRLLGFDDEERPGPRDERAARLLDAARGLRLGSTADVHAALVTAILGQVVTTREAKLSLRRLVAELGEPAPGPNDRVRLLPSPGAIAALGYEDLHHLGVERRRADILVEASRRISRLDAVLSMTAASAWERLTSVRGIGAWTAAHVMGTAWGDRDAIPLGDFHLPDTVAWALAGEERGTDDRMVELLEPYRPVRRRLVVSIKQSGITAPRRGPRTAVRQHL